VVEDGMNEGDGGDVIFRDLVVVDVELLVVLSWDDIMVVLVLPLVDEEFELLEVK
jgi:hypothetical protein